MYSILYKKSLQSKPNRGYVMMLSKEDEFLRSWLKISSTVSNERIVSGMLFKEAQVCNIIYYQDLLKPDKLLSATDLCQATHMHKTLMNRTLKTLEEKEIIEKNHDEKDKRRVIVKKGKKFDEFIEVHHETMEFVKKISEELGAEELIKATDSFEKVANVVDKLFYNN